MHFFEKLHTYIETLDTSAVSSERQAVLLPLATYIQRKLTDNQPVNLNFICTHNSRRSHFSQVWAAALGAYYGIPQLQTYSGGTEATALFPKVVETLTNAGFLIEVLSAGNNPVYAIKYGEAAVPIIGFSKRFDDAFNPQSEFAAVMTCSDADENCPHIPAAEARFAVTFNDPKAFDTTPRQSEAYADTSRLIATELMWVMATAALAIPARI